MAVLLILILFVVLVIYFSQKNSNKKTVPFIQSSQSFTKTEIINDDNDVTYFLNSKVGYFSQAETKEDATFISKLVAANHKNPVRWIEFEKLVLEKFPNYDMDILSIECDNFISMAMSYQKWRTIQKQKGIFPYIRYNAVIDGETCKTCKKLNKIVRPVDDPFWDIYYPPNCPECRCIVEQYEKSEIRQPTDLSKKNLILPPEKFALNVGKHGLKLPY